MNENDVILSKRDAAAEIRYILDALDEAEKWVLSGGKPLKFIGEAREAVKRLQAMIREG